MSARTRGKLYWAALAVAAAGLFLAGCGEKGKVIALTTIATFADARTRAVEELVEVDDAMSKKVIAEVNLAKAARDLAMLQKIESDYRAYQARRDKARAALKAMGPFIQKLTDQVAAGNMDIGKLLSMGADVTELLRAVGVKVQFDVRALANPPDTPKGD